MYKPRYITCYALHVYKYIILYFNISLEPKRLGGCLVCDIFVYLNRYYGQLISPLHLHKTSEELYFITVISVLCMHAFIMFMSVSTLLGKKLDQIGAVYPRKCFMSVDVARSNLKM